MLVAKKIWKNIAEYGLYFKMYFVKLCTFDGVLLHFVWLMFQVLEDNIVMIVEKDVIKMNMCATQTYRVKICKNLVSNYLVPSTFHLTPGTWHLHLQPAGGIIVISELLFSQRFQFYKEKTWEVGI